MVAYDHPCRPNRQETQMARMILKAAEGTSCVSLNYSAQSLPTRQDCCCDPKAVLHFPASFTYCPCHMQRYSSVHCPASFCPSRVAGKNAGKKYYRCTKCPLINTFPTSFSHTCIHFQNTLLQKQQYLLEGNECYLAVLYGKQLKTKICKNQETYKE